MIFDRKKVSTFTQKIAHDIFRGPKIKVGIFAMTVTFNLDSWIQTFGYVWGC